MPDPLCSMMENRQYVNESHRERTRGQGAGFSLLVLGTAIPSSINRLGCPDTSAHKCGGKKRIGSSRAPLKGSLLGFGRFPLGRPPQLTPGQKFGLPAPIDNPSYGKPRVLELVHAYRTLRNALAEFLLMISGIL